MCRNVTFWFSPTFLEQKLLLCSVAAVDCSCCSIRYPWKSKFFFGKSSKEVDCPQTICGNSYLRIQPCLVNFVLATVIHECRIYCVFIEKSVSWFMNLTLLQSFHHGFLKVWNFSNERVFYHYSSSSSNFAIFHHDFCLWIGGKAEIKGSFTLGSRTMHQIVVTLYLIALVFSRISYCSNEPDLQGKVFTDIS